MDHAVEAPAPPNPPRRPISAPRGWVVLDRAPSKQPDRRAGLLLLAILVAMLLAACGGPLLTSSGRNAIRLGLALPEIMVATPFQATAAFVPPIIHEEVEYADGDVAGRATIWRPESGRYPGLIVSLGVNPASADDPRVIRLGQGLARLGLTVMLLHSDALDNDVVEPAEIDRVVTAFNWLERQPFAGPKIGMTGFSVGASLLTIAAADERIRDRVAAVNAFGGFGSLRRLALDTVSRSYVIGPKAHPWEPDELTVRLVRKHLAERLEPFDRALLLEALPGASPPAGPAPHFRTDDARRVWNFLTAPNRDLADEALTRLPDEMLDTLDYLSPDNHLAGIRGELFVMHDRSDKFVPVSESLRMALEAYDVASVHLTEFDLFEHVDVGSGGNPVLIARESAKLFWHVSQVLNDLR